MITYFFVQSCGNKLEKQNVQVVNNIICQKCGNALTSADKFALNVVKKHQHFIRHQWSII